MLAIPELANRANAPGAVRRRILRTATAQGNSHTSGNNEKKSSMRGVALKLIRAPSSPTKKNRLLGRSLQNQNYSKLHVLGRQEKQHVLTFLTHVVPAFRNPVDIFVQVSLEIAFESNVEDPSPS